MSVVWVTSDFEELATTCTRVLVLNNGRASSEMLGHELTPEAITARVFAGQQDADAASVRPTKHEGQHMTDAATEAGRVDERGVKPSFLSRTASNWRCRSPGC